MEENTTPKHPVLIALTTKFAEENKVLTERIAELTNETEINKATIKDLHQRLQLKAKEVFDKETYLNETLMNAIENGYDRETIFYVANELDVSLTQLKTFVVQAEFQVEVIIPIDEEFDADDLDFTLSHDYLNDYTFTGIISSEEN